MRVIKEIVHIFFHQKIQSLEGLKVILSSNDESIEVGYNICQLAFILKTEALYDKHTQNSLIDLILSKTTLSTKTVENIVEFWFKEQKDSQDLSFEFIVEWIESKV